MKKEPITNWIKDIHIKKIPDYRKKFITNKPFKHLEIENFLNEDKIKPLIISLSKQKFYEKEADLFTFYQTNDLNVTNAVFLKRIIDFLKSKEFITYLESITCLMLKPNIIDISGTLYSESNYLLCHDDDLESRKLAFTLYLSTLEENEGGSLMLFSSKNNSPDKIVKKLNPKLNSLVIFEVSKKSFHEVEEVLVDKQRIALSGWFHGD